MKVDFALPVGNGRDEVLDLNSRKELTFGSGNALQAAFQVSPTLGNKRSQYGPDSRSFIYRHAPS